VGSTIYVSYLTNGSPASPIISAGTNNVFYTTISAQNITDKYCTLSSTPSEPTKVLADVVGGTTLEFGLDFSVSGDLFEWDGLVLDGLIEIGDIIRVQYFT